MSDTLKIIFSALGALTLMLAIAFGLQVFGFVSFKFFAPKIVQVQTDVFKSSQAYQDGMATDLGDLKLQYESATDPGKQEAIRAIIKQRFASYDKNLLPPDLQAFYNSL